jgi:hypothetical protein
MMARIRRTLNPMQLFFETKSLTSTQFNDISAQTCAQDRSRDATAATEEKSIFCTNILDKKHDQKRTATTLCRPDCFDPIDNLDAWCDQKRGRSLA